MPSILTHPLAPTPASAAANTPKYLVRSDGMVTVYTAALAKQPNFKPVDVLPAAHVAATQAAAQRDAVTRQARAAHQARMEAAELAWREKRGRALAASGGAAAAVVAPLAAAAGVTPVAKVGVVPVARGRVAVATAAAAALDIGSADRAALKAYFAQHGVKADARRPVEELRALAHEVARRGRAPGGV